MIGKWRKSVVFHQILPISLENTERCVQRCKQKTSLWVCAFSRDGRSLMMRAAFCDETGDFVDMGRAVDAVYLAFSKAFGMFSHSIFRAILMKYWLENWVDFWDQNIGIGDPKSGCWLVMRSGIPQGLILCLMTFNMIVSGLDNGIGC